MKRERETLIRLLLESLCPFPMTTTFDEKGKEEEDHEDEGGGGGSSSKNDDKKITSSSSSFAAVPKAKVSVSRLFLCVVGRLEKAFLNPLSLTPNALIGVSLLTGRVLVSTTKTTTTRRPKKKNNNNRAPRFFFVLAE